jgi:hypothetical protein
MKPATAAQYIVVERRKLHMPLAVFIAVMAWAAGFLTGDWTAEPRFAEREASILAGIKAARMHADQVRESLKRGCFDFVLKKREM